MDQFTELDQFDPLDPFFSPPPLSPPPPEASDACWPKRVILSKIHTWCECKVSPEISASASAVDIIQSADIQCLPKYKMSAVPGPETLDITPFWSLRIESFNTPVLILQHALRKSCSGILVGDVRNDVATHSLWRSETSV
jgi:hypothetical protein